MTIDSDSSLRDVGFAVCSALHADGVVAVLGGGGAATVWAPEAIQSYDLDFIVTMRAKDAAPAEVLASLGYRLAGQIYRHERSRFDVEFPPGPLAIGGDLVTSWSTLREGERLLHVVSPTDSCRDRLAAFYHFRDRSALVQACHVFRARSGDIALQEIAAWSDREGMTERYREFLRAVEG